MVSKVLLVGGSIIQYYMAKSLIERGFAIFYYDLYFPKELIGAKRIQQKQELLELVQHENCVVFCAEAGDVKCVLGDLPDHTDNGLPYKKTTDGTCFVWKPGKDIRFMLREAVAEAVIVEAKLLSGKTVAGSRALVMGFDVYAEEIASLLRAWKAKVLVVPEDEMGQNLARYRGYDTCDRENLMAYLEREGEECTDMPDFVFQCSRDLPLRARQIRCLQPDTILLNLTQDENALDEKYARSLMLQTKHCRNLLSEYAPAVTGGLLAQKLWQDLQE